MTTALPMSDQIMIGRLGRRSTHTPMKRPATIDGSICAATRTPVSVAPAPRSSTAVRGSARTAIWLPTRAMVKPVHSLMKSPLRESGGAVTSAQCRRKRAAWWALRLRCELLDRLREISEVLAIVFQIDAKVIRDRDRTERLVLSCSSELVFRQRAGELDHTLATLVERSHGVSEVAIAEVPAFVVVELEGRLGVRSDLADADQ